jgi:hypothetical protein
MVIFPAILDVGTSSKKVATTQKKGLKLSIHNMAFSAFKIERDSLEKYDFF